MLTDSDLEKIDNLIDKRLSQWTNEIISYIGEFRLEFEDLRKEFRDFRVEMRNIVGNHEGRITKLEDKALS